MATAQLAHRIIQDMSTYVTFLFENREEELDQDLYLPKSLKVFLQFCVKHYRDDNCLHALDHYLHFKNPEEELKECMKLSLQKMAKELPHMGFLRECTLCLMTADILRDLGLKQAPEIVTCAIYQATMGSSQFKGLLRWGKF